jgi:hypothetical protein
LGSNEIFSRRYFGTVGLRAPWGGFLRYPQAACRV